MARMLNVVCELSGVTRQPHGTRIDARSTVRAGAHIGQLRHYFLFYELYIATREAHIKRHAGGFRFQGEDHPFIVLEPGNVTTLDHSSAGADGREAAFEILELGHEMHVTGSLRLGDADNGAGLHAFEREGI